jgi:transposase
MNITPIFLPSRAPELNPVENVWEFLRRNWLSNLVFDTYDEIIAAACDAWRNLEADPERITSIACKSGRLSVIAYDSWYYWIVAEQLSETRARRAGSRDARLFAP